MDLVPIFGRPKVNSQQILMIFAGIMCIIVPKEYDLRDAFVDVMQACQRNQSLSL